MLYWFITALIGMLGSALPLAWIWFGPEACDVNGDPRWISINSIARSKWWTQVSIRWATWDGYSAPRTLSFAALLVWPWLTFLTLQVFQVSMRRAKVNPVHVLRCALYSFDVLLLVGIFGAVEMAAHVIRWLRDSPFSVPVELPALTLLAGLFAMMRLWIAYRSYLRFHQPLATVLASQIIVALFIPASLEIIYQIVGLLR